MDSTIVAVFEDPERADDAKRELVAKGLIDEKDVSTVRQSATTMPHGPLQRLKARLGSPPPLRERGILTVYVDGGRMAEAEQLIRQHHPMDVQIHVASDAGRGAPPMHEMSHSPMQ
ncbi:MAG TPA: hypothetical protein VGI81_16735 [Tepidisphaeraceae bacterium]|jgi:hypothetical protein